MVSTGLVEKHYSHKFINTVHCSIPCSLVKISHFVVSHTYLEKNFKDSKIPSKHLIPLSISHTYVQKAGSLHTLTLVFITTISEV